MINGSAYNTITWQTVIIINGTAYNLTSFRNIQLINGTAYNITNWINIQLINGSCYNTSVPAVLIISDEHPTNDSSIPYTIPTLYFTINSTTGLNMNYTVYWGDNLSETITTATSQNNGTYYHPFSNASSNDTTYTWSVNLTDTSGNWLNETYTFTTRNESGFFVNKRYLPIFIIFGIIPFIILFFWKKKKTKKENKYIEKYYWEENEI